VSSYLPDQSHQPKDGGEGNQNADYRSVAGIPVVSCIPEVNGAGEERNPKEIVDILRLDTRYYGDV
jgi:hypothetical protein